MDFQKGMQTPSSSPILRPTKQKSLSLSTNHNHIIINNKILSSSTKYHHHQIILKIIIISFSKSSS